jgi:lipopolysaccharide transport system ATP-binding protein
MTDLAIRVEGLGKRYRIGQRAPYMTLRETLGEAMRAPFRWLRGNPNSELRTPNSGHIWALKDVSFEVKRGQILGIIGRNGSGKTTLLKILSRVTEPTEGYAEIRGRVGSLLEVGTGFHPDLTGRENIYLNGAILGMKRVEIQRRFDDIVAFSEIEKFLDTPVKRYSSGMYMRLAFAVAAHFEPEILLVDEVLAVGDAAFQQKCLGKMGDVAEQGRTVLFVSHNMTAVERLCPEVMWLNSGMIGGQGDARRVVSRYLGDNAVPLGEVIFDRAGGSGGVALLRACVMDEGLQVRLDVPYARPFHIAVEYQVEFPVEGLRVGFRLYNDRNMAVFHTATSDCPELTSKVGTPGRHRAQVQIPGAWLAPGRYYAELGLWSPKVGHHQHLLSALAFDVIADLGVDSTGEEALRPKLDWSVT